MPEMIQGIYVGIVVENKLSDDSKIDIKLPDLNDKIILKARISGFLAGKQYGALFLPEIDDQVLVAFLKSRLQDPVIIGSIWSKKGEVPDANGDGKNNLKLIKTRGGNEIRLSDEKDKERIEIKTKSSNAILLSDEKDKEKIDFKTKCENEICLSSEKDKEKIEIKTKSGNAILLSDEKDKEKIEFVSGEAKVTIEKKENKITIESTGEISITGKAVTIEAKENMKITGKAVSIEATDGNAEIKANVVNIEAKNKKIKLDADVSVTGMLEVGKSPKTTIQGNTITGG